MRMRPLGRTGMRVSPFCLGTMMFGKVGNPDHDLLDRIDEIVPPGADIGPLDVSYDPPAITRAALRRRPADERAAA